MNLPGTCGLNDLFRACQQRSTARFKSKPVKRVALKRGFNPQRQISGNYHITRFECAGKRAFQLPFGKRSFKGGAINPDPCPAPARARANIRRNLPVRPKCKPDQAGTRAMLT